MKEHLLSWTKSYQKWKLTQIYQKHVILLATNKFLKLLSESEDLENTSLLDLINQSYFQEGILECFDNIEISNHFKNVKKL